MRSFELVAGIALFALAATAIVVVLVPSSSAARVGFAVELVFVGIALVVLALLLSRRSARRRHATARGARRRVGARSPPAT